MTGLARFLVVLALLGIGPALALDPDRHLSELGHRVWDSKTGAPSYGMTMAQTTDGYLWVGSSRGLFRFDGVRFQEFAPDFATTLRAKSILKLFATTDNKLWIAYRGGVGVLANGKLTTYSSADGLPEGLVRDFAQDRQGRLWGASTGGLIRFENGRWHKIGAESGFLGNWATAILTDHRGAMWVAGEGRISVLQPGASRFELTDEPYNGTPEQLSESPDGTVWMAEANRAVRPVQPPGQVTHYRGLSKAECERRFPNTWQTEPKCRRPDDLEVRVGSEAILFDRDGSFWITTLGDGIRRAPYPSRLPKVPIGEFSSALDRFTNSDGLSADVSIAIFEDREGSIWVTTRDGIDQFRNTTLAPVSLGPTAMQLSIAPEDAGYIIAVGSNGHTFRFHDAQAIVAPGRDTKMRYVYRDLSGSIWAFEDGRSGCHFVGEKCTTRLDFPVANPGPQARKWRLAADRTGQLWAFVANKGLFTWRNGRWTPFSDLPPALNSAVPSTQHTDVTGRIWFGFEDGRILTVTAGKAHLYSSVDGLNVGAVTAITSSANHVWVGGLSGVEVLAGQRFTPVLPHDGPAFRVSGVVEGDDGSLWLSEYRGVVRIAPSEVSAVLLHSSHPARFEIFDSYDGLPGETQGYPSPAAIRGTDGRLWFTTTKGAAWVNPGRMYRNELPPPVNIESIVADGKILDSPAHLNVPAGTNSLQIAYAGLSFAAPEHVNFRYRLKGFSDEWQSAGTRRTAYYTRLSPGSYEFEVTASNEAGVWNPLGARIPFRVIPAWYQTWWFYALAASLVAAVPVAFYRLRLVQIRADIRRSLEARLSERERIARELHDTLLQGLQGLIWRFQAATDRIAPEEPARKMMEQSLNRADKLLEESRDKVKDLRPGLGEASDFAQTLATEGTHFAQLSPAKFRVSLQGTSRDLHPIAREEGLLIAREALSNAFRHSGAKEIEAEVTYGDVAFHIRVRDDGRGIDPSVLEAGGTSGHFGFVGMRERAKKLGGHLEVWSNPAAGTEVDLRVPARVAYRRPQEAPSFLRSVLAVFRSSTSPH